MINKGGAWLARTIGVGGDDKMLRVCSAMMAFSKQHRVTCAAILGGQHNLWLIDQAKFHHAKRIALEKKLKSCEMILHANGFREAQITFARTNKYATCILKGCSSHNGRRTVLSLGRY